MLLHFVSYAAVSRRLSLLHPHAPHRSTLEIVYLWSERGRRATARFHDQHPKQSITQFNSLVWLFYSKPTHCWIPAHGYIIYIGDVLATGVSKGEGPPANLCLSPVTVMYILGASNGNHTSAPAAFHFDSSLSCKIAQTEIYVASSSLFFFCFLLIDCFLMEIILT